MMSNYKPILTYELMNEFQSYYEGEKGKKRVYYALIAYKSSEKDDINEININMRQLYVILVMDTITYL